MAVPVPVNFLLNPMSYKTSRETKKLKEAIDTCNENADCTLGMYHLTKASYVIYDDTTSVQDVKDHKVPS